MINKKINADEIWEVAWTYIKNVVDTARESFLILDKDLKVMSANRTFYAFFLTTPKDTEEKLVYKLGNGQWSAPKLKVLLENILPNNTYFDDLRIEHDFPGIGNKVMVLNGRRIYTPDKNDEIILLAMEDITKQVELERQLREYAEKLSVKSQELEERVTQLEKMNKMMVGRELKMDEMKKEIEELKKRLPKS